MKGRRTTRTSFEMPLDGPNEKRSHASNEGNPASDEDRSDVLVIYDEVRESREASRCRAFFANRNLDRIRAGRKPRFVWISTSRGLKPIPVICSDPDGAIPSEGLAVVMTMALTNSCSMRMGGSW